MPSMRPGRPTRPLSFLASRSDAPRAPPGPASSSSPSSEMCRNASRSSTPGSTRPGATVASAPAQGAEPGRSASRATPGAAARADTASVSTRASSSGVSSAFSGACHRRTILGSFGSMRTGGGAYDAPRRRFCSSAGAHETSSSHSPVVSFWFRRKRSVFPAPGWLAMNETSPGTSGPNAPAPTPRANADSRVSVDASSTSVSAFALFCVFLASISSIAASSPQSRVNCACRVNGTDAWSRGVSGRSPHQPRARAVTTTCAFERSVLRALPAV
mmetsp:Transcript_10688/g.45529  ORF Transcript_10688/g.45529 Transcript_10688/m.45529 type:complete len:273 (+) Transcript_10688:4033-4851(+)